MSEIIKYVKEQSELIRHDWISQSGLDEAAFSREVSFAVQHLSANSYLQQCTKDSILKAVMNTAQIGLTLNPVLKFAYLVPRRNGDKLECCLDPSYQGLVKLLTDTGSVNHVEAHIIFKNDQVEINLADPRKVISHVPYFLAGNSEPGEIMGVYSIAKLKDGSFHCEIMSRKDVEEIRDRSEAYKAYKSGKVKQAIWVTYEPEMHRKTVVKRHWKYLPKSDRTEQFAKAIELDNIAAGYADTVDFSDIGFAESLINSSTLQIEEREKLERELGRIEYKHQAQRMINYLLANQPYERSGNIASMKDVHKAMDLSESLDN
jgi:phage RecT family recombinase